MRRFSVTTGWHLPLFPVWLAARGLDPAAIGVVLAAFQLVRDRRNAGRNAPRRPLWLAERGRSRPPRLRRSARWRCSRSRSGFPAILAAVILMSFVSAPVMPLTDAYALKGLGLRGRSLRAGAAVGLGRVHRGEPRRAACCFDLHRAGEPDLADLRGQLRRSPPRRCCWCRSHATSAAAPRAAAGHSHLRQPAFLAIAAAASLIQASHAVYYGFSTLDWSAQRLRRRHRSACCGRSASSARSCCSRSRRGCRRRSVRVALILIGAAGAVLRWTLDGARSAGRA